MIATRESRLALWQAEHVKALLEQRGHEVSLLGMTTKGDQILDRSLSKVGGKGLFVKELEVALEQGDADLAVHSLKDVPMDLPEGFALACVMEREDPRDAFVSNRYAAFADLPQGAVVGTSSLRRVVLLRSLRPDLKIEPLRGNLDTRLRKLDDGNYDAIVLAAAGLKRLGLGQRIRQVFEPEQMLPAAGQGALGIEVRADRADLLELLAPLAHQSTWLTVAAERAVSRAMGGSCSMPLAAFGTFSGEYLQLRAAWGDPDAGHAAGARPVRQRGGRPGQGRRTRRPSRGAVARRRRPLAFLRAMRVVVTRPESEARRWVDDLRQGGFDVLEIPLMAIAPVADPARLHAAWRELAQARAAMFVSGNAVRQFFAQRPPDVEWPDGTRAWATGPGTRQALLGAGVPAEAIDAPSASAAQFDSETLWGAGGFASRRGRPGADRARRRRGRG